MDYAGGGTVYPMGYVPPQSMSYPQGYDLQSEDTSGVLFCGNLGISCQYRIIVDNDNGCSLVVGQCTYQIKKTNPDCQLQSIAKKVGELLKPELLLLIEQKTQNVLEVSTKNLRLEAEISELKVKVDKLLKERESRKEEIGDLRSQISKLESKIDWMNYQENNCGDEDYGQG